MQSGEWYREKVFNLKNAMDEWKYYYIKEVVEGINTAEISVYKVYWTGKISEPRNFSCPIDVVEKLTKVSAEYACTILKLKPPKQQQSKQ
jgi:hypothetical protein